MGWIITYLVIGFAISIFDYFVIARQTYDEPMENKRLLMAIRAVGSLLLWPILIIFYFVIVVLLERYFKEPTSKDNDSYEHE